MHHFDGIYQERWEVSWAHVSFREGTRFFCPCIVCPHHHGVRGFLRPSKRRNLTRFAKSSKVCIYKYTLSFIQLSIRWLILPYASISIISYNVYILKFPFYIHIIRCLLYVVTSCILIFPCINALIYDIIHQPFLPFMLEGISRFREPTLKVRPSPHGRGENTRYPPVN